MVTIKHYPLKSLLLLIDSMTQLRRFHAGMAYILIVNLSPIDLSILNSYKPKKLRLYQRHYILIGIAERLAVNPSQLLQYWNSIIEDNHG